MEDSGVDWEAGSPATVGVPPFLGLTGGGSHHAAARAFVGPLSRTAYVMLPPSHPVAAAFRWPLSAAGDGSSHPFVCSCPPSLADVRRGRALVVKVTMIEVDTYVAPGVLPARLRPYLLAQAQFRDLRVCHCLLLGDMNASIPLTEAGAHLSSLLGISRPGPQWWGEWSDRAREKRPQRCACVRGCRDWADPGSLFCDFCFGESVPQPRCDCPAGCCGVPQERGLLEGHVRTELESCGGCYGHHLDR